jgi:hypothetical protein
VYPVSARGFLHNRYTPAFVDFSHSTGRIKTPYAALARDYTVLNQLKEKQLVTSLIGLIKYLYIEFIFKAQNQFLHEWACQEKWHVECAAVIFPEFS